MPNVEAILTALSCIQLHPTAKEFEIHAAIAQAFQERGIPYDHEFVIGPRARVDFFYGEDGKGIAIEVKKSKPTSSALEAQAARYAAFEAVQAVIIVVEQCVFDPPEHVNGKPVYYVSLAKNWGVTV